MKKIRPLCIITSISYKTHSYGYEFARPKHHDLFDSWRKRIMLSATTQHAQFKVIMKKYEMSVRIRKPTICICENKGADQLRRNCEADRRLCFRYTDSTLDSSSSQIRNFKLLTFFCDCTARVVLDLIRTQIFFFSCTGSDNLLKQLPSDYYIYLI